MNKKKIKIVLVGALLTAVLFSGCTADNKVAEANKATTKLAVNTDEDTKIKKLISDYFVKMYSDSVMNYQKNIETGEIPESLRTFLAKRTIEEGDKNAEIGLNFPRFVGLNGITLISYKPMLKIGSKDEPQIESTFIEEKDGTLLYYSKVNLEAENVLDDTFEANYVLDSTTNTYSKSADIPVDNIDKVKVQAKFDVELVKEGSNYKILLARESTYKKGVKNRLFRYNNDFITRLSYLELSKTADNTAYLNKDDGVTYEKEKEMITTLLDNISGLDSERRTLLLGSWNSSFTEFTKLMSTIGVNKDKDKKKDILAIDENYIEKLPKEALLLQNDINKIRKIDNLKITLHPAYSKLNKWYIVTFDAEVEQSNGILGSAKKYSFDYLIKFSGKDTSIKIDSVKLNGMTGILATKQQKDTKSKDSESKDTKSKDSESTNTADIA